MSEDSRSITVLVQGNAAVHPIHLQGVEKVGPRQSESGNWMLELSAGDKVLSRFPFHSIAGWYDRSAIEP